MSILKVKNGNTWIEIPAGGQGVPSGGTTGQFLRKSNSTDYSTEWSDYTGGVTSVNGMTGDVTVSTIAVQDNAPSGGELVWIDTDESGESITIPQIDDNNVSAADTWSSQKISDEISSADVFHVGDVVEYGAGECFYGYLSASNTGTFYICLPKLIGADVMSVAISFTACNWIMRPNLALSTSCTITSTLLAGGNQIIVNFSTDVSSSSSYYLPILINFTGMKITFNAT